MNEKAYPVTVKGELSHPPSAALWLIKWLLLIPHYIILFFLWIAYFFVTVIAFFAILFTGRYPRDLFQFNVGIMRWAWRVVFYGYNALGTDKYPPFTLKSADYPADLEVDYPEKLSSGLVLVKWWLLAIPHYIIVVILNGGFGLLSNGGLGTILALFGAIARMFSGKYPEDIFKLVVGINLWRIRVAVYTGLMTDIYPPFCLWD
jgi:hypothetical protein